MVELNNFWNSHVNPEAMCDLITLLARCPNPNFPGMKKPYTLEGLSKDCRCPSWFVEKLLSTKGISLSHSRLECQGLGANQILPENQKAYFLGLSLGDYNIDLKKSVVIIGTESEKFFKRELLRQTIGTWGKIHDDTHGLRFFLDPTFSFMAKPCYEQMPLGKKDFFAPFILGVLSARLSQNQKRISLNDGCLLKQIYDQFQNHFGFEFGSFATEKRANQKNLSVISLKSPQEIRGALLEEASIKSLPFISSLNSLFFI